jgi:hypothetical protein
LEAAQIKASAETKLKDLDADTDRIWAERHRIVDDARELARQLLELAETAAERFPAEEPVEPVEPEEGVTAEPVEPEEGVTAEHSLPDH